jgi:hypothetical protein
MHYSLLPESERKIIHNEYRVRALVVFCIVMSITGVAGMVALFPAYLEADVFRLGEIQISSKESKTDEALAQNKAELVRDATSLRSVSGFMKSPLLSAVASEILNISKAVDINSIGIDIVGTSSLQILIQGLAPTRASLLDLKVKLESQKQITKVEFPISELTKSVDVPFSIRITRSII